MEEKAQIVQSNCRHLRNRMAYFTVPGDIAWRSNELTMGDCWCLCTMTPVGPDDHYVAPEVCQPDRSCYKEEDLT